jgi:tetratricopeptide (TPR) repeat protein
MRTFNCNTTKARRTRSFTKNFFVFLCVLLFFVVNSKAASDFEQGNLQYQKNDFKGAIETYNRIIKSGYEAPEVYYNLGNCFYKTNNIPESILNYERALKLAPRDEDIQFNLKLANLKVVDKIQTVDQIFFKRWLESLSNYFTTDSAAAYTIIFMWIALIVLAFFVISWSTIFKKAFFYLGALLLVCSIAFLLISYDRNNSVNAVSAGIVFNPSVYVKSAPNDKSTDLFILHEGTKVQILDNVGSWKKIRLMNNNEGWVRAETLEVI